MPRAQTPPPQAEGLASVVSAVNKQFGAGSLMALADGPIGNVTSTPSGSLALDLALGVGGYPVGRIIEIYGPESGGKTTMALHAVAEVQKLGKPAVFIDAEHALDPEYAAALGVDTDNMLVSQPNNGEEALEIADMVIKSGQVGIVVVDSVAALVPKAEIEGAMGDSHIGLQARLMSQALRKIAGSASQGQTTCIFINQIREKIGVMFGPSETTSGGRALKFYASVRIDVRRTETLKDGNEALGNRTRIKVVKNKVARPFRQAELDIIYGQGINREGGLLDLGVPIEVIRKNGSHYTYGETALGNGREAARRTLAEQPDIAAAIEAAIRAHHGLS